LERFVCKRSQEEITSTNTECIELSDSDEGKESDVSFVEMNTCQSKKIKEFFSVKGISKKEDLTKEVLCDNGVVADCELFFDETGVFNTFGGKPLPGVTGSTTLLSSEIDSTEIFMFSLFSIDRLLPSSLSSLFSITICNYTIVTKSW
jgi:hypothetical protein